MRKRWTVERRPIPSDMKDPWIPQWSGFCISLTSAKTTLARLLEWTISPRQEWRIRHVRTGETHYYLGDGKWLRTALPRTARYNGKWPAPPWQ